jgi:hypothetical protein
MGRPIMACCVRAKQVLSAAHSALSVTPHLSLKAPILLPPCVCGGGGAEGGGHKRRQGAAFRLKGREQPKQPGCARVAVATATRADSVPSSHQVVLAGVASALVERDLTCRQQWGSSSSSGGSVANRCVLHVMPMSSRATTPCTSALTKVPGLSLQRMIVTHTHTQRAQESVTQWPAGWCWARDLTQP